MQDVVEIMKESLYDKYVDDHGFVDFGRSGGMSQQKEAKRFLSALNKLSELQQKDCFSISVSSKIIHLHKIQKTLRSCFLMHALLMPGDIQFGRQNRLASSRHRYLCGEFEQRRLSS